MKKYKEALEDFEEAKKVDPKTGNVDKNIEEAKKRMGETGAGKEDKAGAKKAMGEANAEFKKGNYEGALTHYTKVSRHPFSLGSTETLQYISRLWSLTPERTCTRPTGQMFTSNSTSGRRLRKTALMQSNLTRKPRR